MMPKFKVSNLIWLQLILFTVLVARLVDLQLIKGEKNRILAEENRIQREILPAGRGILYDRHHQPLVENIPFYFYQEEDGEWPEYQAIPREEALSLASKGASEKEKIRLEIGRRYLYPESLAHVLGYIGQVTSEEIAVKTSLEPGDLIGRSGIEQEYDAILRGSKGMDVFEVDASGKKLRTLGEVEPVAGRDLTLSLDAPVSQVARQALGEQPGAVVVTEAKTGKVIALVSSPSFDSNRISSGLTPDEYQTILEDPLKPFFNRALGGVYPPGSVFKIVTAVAGLEEGRIDEQTLIEDQGFIKVGEFIYRNWYYTQYGRTEGEINVVTALKRSTDTFFYRVGERLGASLLSAWAKNFGLGQETGINLPGEAVGLVPDPEWKEKVKGERWFLGNTYHFSIGQADLTATPLQINMMTGAVANEGWLCPPRVAIEGEKWDKGKLCRNLKIKKETLDLVREGMKEACSPGGTAFPLFDFEPRVACKTGTAEFGDPEDRTHAWFTAFAPVDDPEIVVTVLVEKGGEGSQVAAPIAKEVFKAWFNR